MSTVVFDLVSKAFPTITNRIRAAVYKETSPLAIVAQIIDTTAGHPQRVWHFPGLNRENYKLSLDEIDASDNPIANLALFDVVPGTIDGLLSRKDEQIKVGTTVGFVTGATSFTFDGTGGKPDYIGWEIVPSELTGRGILVRGLDYSWDKTVGTFTLLQAGDVFPEFLYYNIHFEPQINPIGNSVAVSNRDYTIRLITSNTTLDDTDFGKKLIVEPAGVYMTVTLPLLSSVAEGRPLLVEIGGSGIKTVKFVTSGA
ncbi:MAG: hypothetical protein ABIW79_01110, partial [Gemmatimonas sp.]